MSLAKPEAGLFGTPWSFGPGELDAAEAFYRQYGFVVLAGAMSTGDLAQLELECLDAQERLAAGLLEERHGTTRFDEEGPSTQDRRLPNYVSHITELSSTARRLLYEGLTVPLLERWLGPQRWSAEGFSSGFVYQDARPGPDSGYKRIGWHSDWQSSPHLDIWPSTAVTLHIDGTSPANGFLRVVPGSHLWSTPAPYENVNEAVVPEGAAPTGGYGDTSPPVPMPLRFDKVPGEVALYCQVGDILFHDCYLWHSAAIATDLESRRRHVRGGWFAGRRPAQFEDKDFVKNAAR